MSIMSSGSCQALLLSVFFVRCILQQLCLRTSWQSSRLLLRHGLRDGPDWIRIATESCEAGGVSSAVRLQVDWIWFLFDVALLVLPAGPFCGERLGAAWTPGRCAAFVGCRCCLGWVAGGFRGPSWGELVPQFAAFRRFGLLLSVELPLLKSWPGADRRLWAILG